MFATPYPDINALLDEITHHIQSVLQENAVGVYLYGSLVWGDFDEEISDIDLLVVTHRALDPAEFEALENIHRDLVTRYPAWEERIEVAYVALPALQTFKETTSTIAVISPGEPFHLKDAGIDWLINWYMVRRKGAVLLGPPPDTLIPEISQEEFIEAVRGQAKGWEQYIYQMRRRAAQAYGILTLCRALYAWTLGEQVSKRQAAEWAADAFPDWSVLIRNALIWRDTHRHVAEEDDTTFPDTLRFVEFVMAKMETSKG